MLRYLLAALLLAASVPVCARVHLEIGAGIAQASPRHSGTWYQDGYPYTLKTSSPVAEVDLRWQIRPGLDLITGLIGLGSYSSDSQDNPSDAAYAAHVKLPLSHYVGSGSVWGVQALLERTWGDTWQVGLKGGLLAYHETWRIDVADWYPSDPVGTHTWYKPREVVNGYNIGPIIPLHTNDQRWAVGAIVGVTLRHRDWPVSLSLEYVRDGADFSRNQGSWPPIWASQFVALAIWRF